jgi:SAM-dependent methyltransferase
MAEAINYTDFLIQEIIQNCGSSRKLMDFGAGVGTFALKLRKRGFKVVCIEQDDLLRERLLGDGLQCYPDLGLVPPSSVEFIYTLNVLEHIEDDRAAIHQIYSRLEPGGRLYIYLPAFNVLFSSMDRKVGHFRRYTKSSLIPLLREAGFAIDKARYVDSLGFLATLLYRLIGSRTGELNLSFLAFYDRLIFPVSRFLDSFAASIIGKNLAVTAIRPLDDQP